MTKKSLIVQSYSFLDFFRTDMSKMIIIIDVTSTKISHLKNFLTDNLNERYVSPPEPRFSNLKEH